MTLDHKIRICVGHLRGKRRDEAIMKLRLKPELLPHAMKFNLFRRIGRTMR